MMNIYEEFLTLHKACVPWHNMQKKSQDNAKSLKVVDATIIVIHEWGMKYIGAPPELVKKIKQ